MLLHERSKLSNSTVIHSKPQRTFIKSLVPGYNKHTKFHLLYRGSSDGWSASQFHQRCDGKGPTLVLAGCRRVGNLIAGLPVSENQVETFGGFTSQPWKSSMASLEAEDDKAFVFSTLTRQKYPVDCITTNGARGPIFGHDMLVFSLNEPPKASQFRPAPHGQSIAVSQHPLAGVSLFPVTSQNALPMKVHGLTGDTLTTSCLDIEVYLVQF